MSFFRYPGGKAKLRAQILSELSGCRNSAVEYREPFFGGGSIGIELQKVEGFRHFWLNDKDPAVFALWCCVFNHTEEFLDKVNSYVPSVADFYAIRTELLALDKAPHEKESILDIGFKKLVIHQISYSGLGTKSGGPLGGESQESKYKIGCRWSPKNIVKKVRKIVESFDGVDITCTSADFEDIISDTNRDALIYLDPPYVEKGGELYQHSFTLDDHRRLATVLSKSTMPWVLSYDDAPLVRELYSWAKIREISVNYTISTSRNKSELLIFPHYVS
jgi:DNA adenine methylase